jgi:hypothetical protein
MSKFDVHIKAIASDYIMVEADSKEEAKKIMQERIENDFDFIRNMLTLSMEYVEVQDVEIDDVVDFWREEDE